MLFQLSEQNYPNAIHTSVIPEKYASIALAGHETKVTIDESCTLIHQTIHENGYNICINNFFIQKPLVLYVLPKETMYTLYYSIENTAKIISLDKETIIKPEDFSLLELAPVYSYGIFIPGTYRSLHINTDEANKSILKEQDYLAALLREHYFAIDFQPH